MTDEDPDLRREVRELRSEFSSLESRLSSLESALERRDGEERDAAAVEGGFERTTEGPSGADSTSDAPPTADSWTGTSREPTPEGLSDDVDVAATETGADGRDWELDVGIRWLGVVGVFALLVGVGLFVRYAIQQDLLGYAARIVLGTGAGMTMVALGRYATRYERYERLGAIVVGGGLAITAFSLYAAYGFEAYREAIGTTLGVTVTLLTVVVAIGLGISLRDDRALVGGESILIGYLTAVITIPEWGALTLAYAFGLTVAVGVVAVDRDRPILPVGGVLGSYGVYATWWWEAGAVPGDSSLVGGAYLVSAFGCYLAVALYPVQGTRSGWRAWFGHALVAANPVLFASFFERLFVTGDVTGRSLTLLALAVVFAGVVIADDRRLVGETPVAPYLTVGFYALAVDMALSPVWVTIVLAASLLASLAASIRLDQRHAHLATHGLAVLLVTKVAFADATGLTPVSLDPVTVPTRLLAFLAAIAACYGTAIVLYRRSNNESPVPSGHDPQQPRIPWTAYAWTATGLVTELLWLELSSYPLSVAWAGVALILLGVGFVAGIRSLRLQGVALLAVTTLKVFIVDTSGLDPLTRTLSFLTLGLVLLVAAFAYARYAGRLGDPVTVDASGSGAETDR